MQTMIVLAQEGEEHALNPLIPHPIEIVLSIVVFGLLFFAIRKFVVPSFEKTFSSAFSRMAQVLTRMRSASASVAVSSQACALSRPATRSESYSFI